MPRRERPPRSGARAFIFRVPPRFFRAEPSVLLVSSRPWAVEASLVERHARKWRLSENCPLSIRGHGRKVYTLVHFKCRGAIAVRLPSAVVRSRGAVPLSHSSFGVVMRDSMSKRWMRCALAVASAAALAMGCAEEGSFEPVEQVSESWSPEAPAAQPQHLVVSEFVATFDAATGEFSIEELPFEEWQSANGVSPDGIRAASQPLYCQQRLGPELRLRRMRVHRFDPVAVTRGERRECGLPVQRARRILRERDHHQWSPRRFDAVYAELVDVSPPEYAGYRTPTVAALILRRSQGRTSPRTPTGRSFGEVHLPARPGRASRRVGPAERRRLLPLLGRILVPIVDTHDGIDNDCDGRVDNSIGVYGEGEACLSDDDCYSGACADGFCAAACADGFYGIGCGDECPGGAANPCYGNGTCNDGAGGDGSCACEAPFGGSDCGDCDAAHYGANCAYECPGGAANACNGSGTCDAGISGLGTCACDAGAHGDACEFSCTDGVRTETSGVWTAVMYAGPVLPGEAHRPRLRRAQGVSWAIASDGSRMVAGAVGESTRSNGEGAVSSTTAMDPTTRSRSGSIRHSRSRTHSSATLSAPSETTCWSVNPSPRQPRRRAAMRAVRMSTATTGRRSYTRRPLCSPGQRS